MAGIGGIPAPKESVEGASQEETIASNAEVAGGKVTEEYFDWSDLIAEETVQYTPEPTSMQARWAVRMARHRT